MKRLLATILFSLFAFAAHATCPVSFPYILTNGQPADANQVMANYNAIQSSCAASGANTDITSLGGLTTPLSQAQGGTGSSSGLGIVPVSQERLTLTTGVPVLTSTVSAATTVYYTPYIGNDVPLFNVGGVAGLACPETSNVLSATTNSGPFAAASNAVYDMFEWNNSGTCTLTRGDMWQETATITVTIASPAVVTYTGHGLLAGSPVRFSTTGALPTGITAGTNYYVISAGLTTNTFEISTSVGGSAVNTTGSQSGTQTAVAGTGIQNLLNGITAGRGTAPALSRSSCILANTNSIANGPTSLLGTYVGTIATDAATATVTFQPLPGAASGGAAAVVDLWNMYNRVNVSAIVQDSKSPWTYSSNTFRQADASPGNQASYVYGENEDAINADYQILTTVASNSSPAVGIGVDVTTTATGSVGFTNDAAALNMARAIFSTTLSIGRHTIIPLELSNGGGTATFDGTNDGGIQTMQFTLNLKY